MSRSKKKASGAAAKQNPPPESPVTFYPAWCKRCSNCVAFCPRRALAVDEWGHPYLAQPERCTSCGLCEMLCPDFAISVGEPVPGGSPAPKRPAEPTLPSPERLAPAPDSEDKDG